MPWFAERMWPLTAICLPISGERTQELTIDSSFSWQGKLKVGSTEWQNKDHTISRVEFCTMLLMVSTDEAGKSKTFWA